MDEKVIKEWYEKYSVGIYRFALAILGNPYSAEDVLQETFMKAFRKSGYHIEKEKVQAWLYKIARNCCYDILRSKKREELTNEIQEAVQPYIYLSETSNLEYVDMIANLNSTEKEIVSLHIIAGLTHGEIAKVMNLTVGGAKKRYERAVQKLRIEFQEEKL